ncbi:hypothetical protein M9H77_18402 [Catharanthus roseus]|uniref:Uncharacterized protein n=1 Tax=Catharanthus roseus TaxID=4058 RepID=A0ACC0B7C5_CATRO|nr:hypothetical protein M9H77_18402 [Catharanthus roseus]
MEYNWFNPSWKRIQAKCKQEDYHSKLARDMYNLYHGSGNGVNAYGRNNHRNRNFTRREHVGDGNFSFHAKSFVHTSFDYYGGYDRVNVRYDYKEHIPHDFYEDYHHSYADGTLFYHLPFKDFQERIVFKEKGRELGSFENFVSTFPRLNLELLTFVN